MKTHLLITTLGLALLTACKKEITQPNSGIFRGTFFQIQDNGDTTAQGITYIALSDESMSFSLSGDTASGAPISCYGDYVINNGTQMTFTNEAIVETGYQPHYVLDTIYDYVFDDHIFNLTFQDDTTLYEYKLIRD